MPPVSQAQRALMHGIASGDIPAGGSRPSMDVAKEFADSDEGGKLPKKAPKESRSKKLYGKKPKVRRG